jgi:nucleotide-binding universal stress UspA family protein
MFKKILFPTDFSEPAKSELNCITSFPGIQEIILLHVIKQYAIPMGAEMIESLEEQAAEIYLNEAKDYITALNPDIRVSLQETTSSDITDVILETAEMRKADLIVIHTYIKGIMSGMLRSCVPTKVLCRISKANIMFMPNKLVEALTGKTFEKFCPMIFSRILCPTNFSEYSVRTTALAGTMNGVGEIILLHTVQKSEDGGTSEDAVKTAELRVKTICEELIPQGIKARTIVVAGRPEVEIPKIAIEEDVSLIWMRAAAKGCLHDFFFGSMVHDVVMNATRPVIVIRSLGTEDPQKRDLPDGTFRAAS